jgi:hypothetical protein
MVEGGGFLALCREVLTVSRTLIAMSWMVISSPLVLGRQELWGIGWCREFLGAEVRDLPFAQQYKVDKIAGDAHVPFKCAMGGCAGHW